MDKAKSPRANGFSMHFYQVCWETVKKDIMKVFAKFYEQGKLSKAMKSTIIILIPKKEGTRELVL